MSQYKITFITPLFSRGVFEDTPEVRPPSIRGQLHWWFRALGGTYEDEKNIFGGIHRGASASKIVIRVSDVDGSPLEKATLPHKTGGRAASKIAFPPGTLFVLHVLTRLGGLDSDRQEAFDRTLKAWLLMGSLGLRSTRAAGNFIYEPQDGGTFQYPQFFDEYEDQCRLLLDTNKLKFALLPEKYEDSEKARKIVSDSLGGCQELNYPLGNMKPRKTSPLRYRIVQMGKSYRIAALWDNRSEVTGNSLQDLKGIIKLLQERKPELGEQLAQSLNQLIQ